MNIMLIAHTPEPEKIVAAAARCCYSNVGSINLLMDDMTDDKAEKLIHKLINAGHEAPFEHVSYTFGVEGVSRSLLAQITRHRVASFSVRSQRYCEEPFLDVVVPRSIRGENKRIWDGLMVQISRAYSKFLKSADVKKEDARFILPNACTTRFMVTMNVRELWHFFNLRCCERAQWEIRGLAEEMLTICKKVSPALFEKAGPSCMRLGYCPEGALGCGKVEPREEKHE